MSDYLKGLDEKSIPYIVRQLQRDVAMLKAQQRSPADPNGQLQVTDDGIQLNDLGLGIEHDTVYNNTFRRWRLGSMGVASDAPAACLWDYYQELGQDFAILGGPSVWTPDANTGTIVWDMAGTDIHVTFTGISSATTKHCYSPYYTLPSNYDMYFRAVCELVGPTGGKAYSASVQVIYYDVNNTLLTGSNYMGRIISATTGIVADTNEVHNIPNNAAKFRIHLQVSYDSASGPSNADIYCRINPDLTAKSTVKPMIDIFRKAFSLNGITTTNTVAVSLTGAASGSWDAAKTTLTATVTTNPADTVSGTSKTRLFPCVPSETYYFILSNTITFASGSPMAYLEAEWYDAHQNLIRTDTLDSRSTSGTNLAGSGVAPDNAAYVSIRFRGTFSTGGTAASGTINFYVGSIRMWSFNLYQGLIFDDHLVYFDGLSNHDMRIDPVTSATIFGGEFRCYNAAGVQQAYPMTISASDFLGAHWSLTSANANNGDYYTVGICLAPGTYTVTVIGVTFTTGGQVDWYLDDVLQTSAQDWHSGSTTYCVVKTFTLTVPSSGYHLLKAVLNGTLGADYVLGLNAVIIS